MNKLLAFSRVALLNSIKNPTYFHKNFQATPHQSTVFANKRWKSYTAAILEEYDKPLIVTKIKNDTPVGPGMVQVKVAYCSLNTNDVQRLSSKIDDSDVNLLPQIPGAEFSGEVLAVGNYTVENLNVGDKVVALLSHDHQIGGGLAEESVVNESDCFPIGSVRLKDAALLLNGHGTALLAFTKICPLEENDCVIIIAGAGGNGLAAVQIAKNVFKAKVYVICDTDDSSTIIRDEGAHKSISVNEGLTKCYKFLETGLQDKKAKCVYDAVGNGLMYVAADFVDKKNGKFVTVDPLYNAATFSTTKPEFKKTKKKKDKQNNDDDDDEKDKSNDLDEFVGKIQRVNLFDERNKDKELYRQIIEDTLALCEEEIITPYVSKIFGLAAVNDAVEFIKGKTCTGKVLIDINMKVDVKDKDKDKDDNDDDDKKKDKV